ncbi:hypothetical protein DPMN_028986 [Dreissena polymorpha]|uniref:Uncharacterized protein n=1 Tax=Dreissena polymorpha TaxID=45954 RepID=A0A9D4LXX8_DREPO|nr:hypothetical protein DPMN_028986 [Dreissena polymorpha]
MVTKSKTEKSAERTGCIESFFERDDVSRCMPGKQDVTQSNDEQKKQTRILTDYLSNLHEIVCAETEGIKCSLAQFCKLRPRHTSITLTSLISRNTCLCTTHQNMALKLKCLRSVNVDISPNPEVVSKAVG